MRIDPAQGIGVPTLRAARMEEKIMKVPESEAVVTLGQSKRIFATSDDLEKDLAIHEQREKPRTVEFTGLGAGMMEEAKNHLLDGSEGSLYDVYIPMGLTAENVAERCKVSREAQDEWALISQTRAVDAALRARLAVR